MYEYTFVSAGQVVKKSSIRNEEYQYITGGRTIKTTVYSGGCQSVSRGIADSTTIYRGGMQLVGNVTHVSSNNYKIGGGCSAINTTVLEGGAVCLLGGAVVRFAPKKPMAGSISFQGYNNKVYSINTNSKSDTSFILNAPTTKIKKYMVVADKKTQQTGKFYINLAKYQKTGVYYLSKNILVSSGQSFNVHMLDDMLAGQIRQGYSKLGTVNLNGKAFSKNGFIYSLKSSGAAIKLTLSLKVGSMQKSTAKGGKFAGTSDCDIFCNGKGNDTFSGMRGRDVAVYGKTTWGRDVIAKTNGTMTILFNELKKSDINMENSGKDLIITKKNDSRQRIIIKNFDDGCNGYNQTYDIRFASGMTAFNKYLKLSKPSKAQKVATRNEVWKKAGLASA